jgi:ribosomal protein S18 acetylase RimI-like enzyme
MYVDARYRRQGVGRMLLAAAIDYLSGFPEIATIRLWVSPEQHPARALYASLGFRIVTDAEGRPATLAPGDNRPIMERPAHLRSSEGA